MTISGLLVAHKIRSKIDQIENKRVIRRSVTPTPDLLLL